MLGKPQSISEKAQSGLIQQTSESCSVRRRARRIKKGLLRIDQEIKVSDRSEGIDVTGRFWMFAIVRVCCGTIKYVRNTKQISVLDSTYGMFAPPYSVVEVSLERSHSISNALASAGDLPEDFPKKPVVFNVPSDQCPASITEMADLLRIAPAVVEVGRGDAASALALRIKETIDQNYMYSQPLSEIAAKHSISPATLSRTFKKSFGMRPIAYRHHLRIMDGMMRLLDGQSVMDIFQEVGFDDLSRFYRQFKKRTLAPPGTYRL